MEDVAAIKEWNEEYAAIYRITYTPNYKVVTDIEIVQDGKDFTQE